MVNNSTTKRSVDLCVGLDVIIVGIMDAMAGTTAVAVDAAVEQLLTGLHKLIGKRKGAIDLYGVIYRYEI